MASNPKSVIRDLEREIGRDFSSTVNELHRNLQSTTPVQSGRARRGWQKTYSGNLPQGQTIIERNHTDYIGVLDTGTSQQAPQGIVIPAIRKTRNLK